MTRLRPMFLGLLGIAAITFPFLWLQLQPNFTNNTVTVAWSPAHGVQFFSDLLPVFVIAFLIWLGVRASRHWGWNVVLSKNPTWLRATTFWKATGRGLPCHSSSAVLSSSAPQALAC